MVYRKLWTWNLPTLDGNKYQDILSQPVPVCYNDKFLLWGASWGINADGNMFTWDASMAL